jgi:hypothetical protein
MMNYDYPMTLEKEALVTLSHLKTFTPEWVEMSKTLKKHHKKCEGRCWMDLTVDSGTKGRWPTVKVVRDRYSRSLNLDVKFHVWLINPWMVHIEMTEEEGWTAQEVLSLPDWFMVGGTFEEDALGCGYTGSYSEFLRYVMLYSTTRTAGYPSRPRRLSSQAVHFGQRIHTALGGNRPANFLNMLHESLIFLFLSSSFTFYYYL